MFVPSDLQPPVQGFAGGRFVPVEGVGIDVRESGGLAFQMIVSTGTAGHRTGAAVGNDTKRLFLVEILVSRR